MDYVTSQTIEKSLDSYKAAFLRMLKRCPRVQLEGGGSPIWDTLRGRIEKSYHLPASTLIPELDSISANQTDSLFEYRSPKIIDEGYWLWKDSFFRVSGRLVETFEVFGMCCAMISEDGTRTPEKMESRQETLSLGVPIAQFGVGDFIKRPKQVLSLMDSAKPKQKQYYLEEVGKAFRAVDEWKAAIKSIRVPA